MKLETNGHYFGYDINEQFMRMFVADNTMYWGANPESTPGWRVFVKQVSRSYACSHCGHRPKVETDGTDYRFVGEPCPHPEGLTTEFELACPSGMLVVANDLRGLAPVATDTFNVNTIYGCHQTTHAYVIAGMAHAFVGNTCPGVFKSRGHSYRIGYERRRGNRVAGICTDLWWYSIIDADLYASRVAYFGDPCASVQTVKVKPGVYKFTHGYNRESDTFATFKWVRPCSVEPDTWLENFKSETLDAGACVAQLMRDWPTLYGDNPLGALNSIFDGSDDWHPNGHPVMKIDPDIVPVELGPIDGQHHWHITGGVLAHAAGIFHSWESPPEVLPKLNASFLRAAYFMLKNILTHGVVKTERDDLSAATVALARRIFAGLSEKYPEFDLER
jgi:hypothetical protein